MAFTGAPNTMEVGYRMLMGAWYVQDSITLRPNLNVRVGLRHEFTSGWNEVEGRESNFIPDANGVLQTNPILGKVLTENNARLLFGPRVALAWDPLGKGKTSIRAGVGSYYSLQDALGFWTGAAPPFNGTITFGQNTSFASLVPVNPAVAAPPACGPGVPQPCAIYAPQGLQSTMKTPTVEQWNFSLEQQITSNTAFRAAYAGSHGYHLPSAIDPNAIRAQICSNPSGCVSGGMNKVTGFVPQGAEYIPVGTRPNPYLANGYFPYYEGNSSYNSLQLDLTHRFGQGLQFRGNYTWAKNLSIADSFAPAFATNGVVVVMNGYDVRRDWGPAAADVRHQASVSGSYELPFGHGKPLLSGVSGAASKLASGWQINWIITALSGFPYTLQAGANQSGDGNTRNPDRPTVNPAFRGLVTLGNPNRWFDPNAFLVPMSGTYGNVGRGTLRGAGLTTLDVSLFKNTAITESMRLEFRAESFNLLNRANFGTPNPIIFSGGAISPTAGIVSSTATTSRQIQFGLKLIF